MQELMDSAKRGLERAGFVDVVTHAYLTDCKRYTMVSGTGMCPCGEMSRFAIQWSNSSNCILSSGDIIENMMFRTGTKHIAVDRAEGRWHD